MCIRDSHIIAQCAHGLHTFQILFHFFRCIAVYLVPVLAGYHLSLIHICPAAGELLAYVDGSYQDALKKYGFGCIFILPDGRIYTEYGNGDNPDSLKQRNVSGEMLGAMYAVSYTHLDVYKRQEW